MNISEIVFKTVVMLALCLIMITESEDRHSKNKDIEYLLENQVEIYKHIYEIKRDSK